MIWERFRQQEGGGMSKKIDHHPQQLSFFTSQTRNNNTTNKQFHSKRIPYHHVKVPFINTTIVNTHIEKQFYQFLNNQYQLNNF